MNIHDNARQPVVFIPHGGGPCFFMDWNPTDTWVGMEAFLKGVAATLPQKPKAIVLISAHWLAPQFRITGNSRPDLIYDYYGFPPHTYELTYPAPGNPQLAEQITQLLHANGTAAEVDNQRGFDHGVFIPLKVMLPDADIPVVQLSLQENLDPQTHLQLGKALAGLRDENILIVASGMSFHNMRGYGDSRFTSISDEFDSWLSEAINSPAIQREALLVQWQQAPHATLCHPPGGEEHFIPLLVAVGAAGDDAGKKIYSERVMKTTVSAFRFG